MRIGIIVHSHTGNTLSVARKLRDKLLSAGHSVSLERVTAYNEDQNVAESIKLKNIPGIDDYDIVIFGAPVRGFSLSPVMAAYLTRLKSLSDKKVACFLTQFFPSPSMGGTRAMSQMKELCSSKGKVINDTGIVNWSSLSRKKKINEVVERFSRIV